MFLLVLNEPQARRILARPWILLCVGVGVLLIAGLFGGMSPYLAAAVLIAHATFLAFMQLGAVGMHRLAVNFAYTLAILVGAAVGFLLFGLPLAEDASGARAHDGA